MDAKKIDKFIRIQEPLLAEGTSLKDNKSLIDFYKDRLQTYGLGGRALAYHNDHLYQAKLQQYYQILRSVIEMEESVLDVGCGYGSLLNVIGPCHYTGIDLVPDFIETAKNKYPEKSFFVKDVISMKKRFDWTIGLGITGTAPNPAQLVLHMWELCRKGILIDFLDSTRYKLSLNRYIIANCVQTFHALGASNVQTYSFKDYVWVIIMAVK